MKVNTALLFVLSSVGVLCRTGRKKPLAYCNYFLGTTILVIGSLSFLQYLLEINLSIDNFLIQDPYSAQFPGRMARTTALCFALFGLGLIASNSSKRLFKKIAKYSLGLVTLIALLAILTYFMQAITTTRVLVFNSMAFHTSVNFFVLSLALSLTNPRHTYIDFVSGVKVGSKLARNLLPFLVILPLLLSFVLLYIISTRQIDTELGITFYTISYAFFGLVYTSWFSARLNKEDLRRLKLEHSLYNTNKQLSRNVLFKEQLVKTTPESIIIINLNKKNVRYINKDVYAEEGLTKERIEGMPLEEIVPYIHPQDRQKIIELHQKLLKSSDEDIYDIEIRLKLKKKSWEWFSVRGTIFDRKNESWVNEYILLVRNITNLKQTQKELMNARQFSIFGDVARTLAHELRNPIASIAMATEMLEHTVKGQEKEEVKSYLNILNRSNHTLNQLVSDLLNASKYKKTELQRQNLANVVDDTLGKAADRIYLAGIRLEKNYNGPYFILADKEKLEIALLNLIINAAEATTPGKGRITIKITEEEADVEFTISDNGHGLEKEQEEKLFNNFYTNKANGVGVGLNSVKNILEEHDAEIKVNSKLQEGTTFSILFPRADN
ncbi:PAS domain-containing sensor histidine kinase [Zunongwangia sp. F363]|uniref:histidine kinase n=1 Tax=Autumnicola tepida TaxID=3075595 RepID=A0ABU3CD96_9FLAO|nr:PAS domain-containing sensor histidine kinase [Zunongwangia sp. F363]MDT0644313.1 PAS domain-containing sensor histidine kinase [Zunongwangia sp. F363]